MKRRNLLNAWPALLLPAAGCATRSPSGAETARTAGAPASTAASGDGGQSFSLRPIGRVEIAKDKAALRIFEPYVEGLLGLEAWSHVQVFYWFDRNDTPEKRRILRVHPRGNRENPLTGVFACRSPFRPNLIALSLCRILAVEGAVVRVEGIDAFDGTPVLDLKPFTPADAPAGDVRVPDWARRGPGGPRAGAAPAP